MYSFYVIADVYRVQIKTTCFELSGYVDNHFEDFRRLTIYFSRCFDENKQNDMIFVYIDSDEYELTIVSDNEILLKCPWNNINESTIIPMVFRLIVERLRQDNKEIKMHASAVSKNETAVLFIAPSEGGKTSTAMRLCQNFGYELIANDAAVISYVDESPMVLRGDSLFKVRANGLEAYSNNIEKTIEMAVKTDTPWYEKKLITAEELGVTRFNKTIRLKYIFFVKLDALVKKCSTLKYSKEEDKEKWFKQRMMVLQNITGTMRGVDLIPTGNDGFVLPLFIPSVDSNELSSYRVSFLNSLFNDCEIYQVRGGLDEITEHINHVVNGS